MKLTLTFIESDRRGNEKVAREVVLRDESEKNVTKGRAAKLIARFHPELKSAGSVRLLESKEHPQYLWHIVKPIQLGTNRWLSVYVSA